MGLLVSALNFLIQMRLWAVLIKTGVRQDVTRLTLQDMALFVAINTMAKHELYRSVVCFRKFQHTQAPIRFLGFMHIAFPS